MNFRCQGCRNYHRDVYRRLGLGSVCSPECEATVRAKQRGGKTATASSARNRDSYFVEPAPGAGDSADTAASSVTDDTTKGSHAAPGDAGDIKMLDGNQRDGTHDSTSRSGDHDSTSRSDHDSKKSQREGTLATCLRSPDASAVVPRQEHLDPPRSTARGRDWQESSILERDQRCRFCGTRRDLHVHHISYRSQGGSDEHHNLIALCVRHHRLVHSDKRLWQPLLRAYIWLLYVEGRRLFLLDIKRIYGPPIDGAFG